MDAHEVQRLLRQDAARLDRELGDIDAEQFAAQVLARLGLDGPAPDPELAGERVPGLSGDGPSPA